MSYGRGYGGRGGRGRGRGLWPGNGPFRNLPPWERPGWLYGPGSCWTLGYRTIQGVPITPGTVAQSTDRSVLESQRQAIENQLKLLQESLASIEQRLKQLEQE